VGTARPRDEQALDRRALSAAGVTVSIAIMLGVRRRHCESGCRRLDCFAHRASEPLDGMPSAYLQASGALLSRKARFSLLAGLIDRNGPPS